jgi:uncharacterized protein YkwD
MGVRNGVSFSPTKSPARRFVALVALVALVPMIAACSPALPDAASAGRANRAARGASIGPAGFARGPSPLPDAAPAYRTDPLPAPAPSRASAGALEQAVVAAARMRGDELTADGRLSTLAAWAASEQARGARVGGENLDVLSRRLGHVGPVPWILFLEGARIDEARARLEVERALERFPKNMRLARYGVGAYAAGGTETVALAFSTSDVTLEPIPKRFGNGEVLRLRGALDARFERAHVALTLPGGLVAHFDEPSATLDVSLHFVEEGVHRVEVLGDGPSGPVVVANFPVYVGVAEPEPELLRVPRRGTLTPEVVEDRMLGLMNEARARAGLSPLLPDPELAEVARAHSGDMAENGFFGHVSPNTGSPSDRVKRASLALTTWGENVGQGGNADEVHAGLWSSPAHRSVMLASQFSHVGIGAVVRPSAEGDVLVVTQLFGKRPGAAVATFTGSDVVSLATRLRAMRGLRMLPVDDAFSSAATAWEKARANADAERALAAAFQQLKAASKAPKAKPDARAERAAPSPLRVCAIELSVSSASQAASVPNLVAGDLRRVGVGVVAPSEKTGDATRVLLLLEHAGDTPCR